MEHIYHPPAKINLGLWVHNRRDDGFHELSTIFLDIPFHDKITVFESNTKEFICEAFPGNDNLCCRAWQALEEHVGRELPAKIVLEKFIPAEAGLGGASADASHTLKALNSLYDLNLSDDTLIKIASSFGSDTAFFIKGGCQLGEGRGEELKPLVNNLKSHLLLAIPHVGCSTPAVFKTLTPPFSTEKNQLKDLEAALERGKLSDVLSLIHNDLTEPACKVAPSLKEFMHQLSEQFITPFFLSGSGSSCFALLDSPLPLNATTRNFDGRYLGHFDLANQSTHWECRS